MAKKLEDIILRHGLPVLLWSDNGTGCFISQAYSRYGNHQKTPKEDIGAHLEGTIHFTPDHTKNKVDEIPAWMHHFHVKPVDPQTASDHYTPKASTGLWQAAAHPRDPLKLRSQKLLFHLTQLHPKEWGGPDRSPEGSIYLLLTFALLEDQT